MSVRASKGSGAGRGKTEGKHGASGDQSSGEKARTRSGRGGERTARGEGALRRKACETLVTGATGFLGRHLVEQLVAASQTRVRAFTIDAVPAWLEELGVEALVGSVLDSAVVERALSGVRQVYHLAGRVSRNPDDARSLYEVHVEGTRVLCSAARAAGVEKIVLASSSGTIAVSESAESLPDETWPPPLPIISRWPYYTSKLYQERTALDACVGGPQLTMVNPSLLLGPGDDRLSSTADVLRFLEGDIPAIPPGGLSFVDARDAAAALVAAMERGRDRESYLVGGPNWTFSEFFARLERVSKVSAPRLRMPKRLGLLGARLLDAAYRHFDKLPPMEYASYEMATYFWYLDDSKARRELGHTPRDPLETLQDTVSYQREHFADRDAFGNRRRTGRKGGTDRTDRDRTD